MPLLDLANDPNIALAAGLLSPTRGGSFGGGLLQGIGASNRSRSANSIDQLRQLQAQQMQNPLGRQGVSPMSVKEFQYYQTLNEDDKNTFMQLKRDQWKNLGGEIGMVTPQGGLENTIQKTLKPGEEPAVRFQQAVATEQGKSDVQRAMQPVIQAETETAVMDAEKREKMKNLPEMLDEAESILTGKNAPTGSGVGALADTAAGFFGATLPGGAEAAQLKAVGTSIMMSMPRMEGPQSDKDVKAYREQAGRISDPAVPVDQRLSGLKIIRKLNEKYRPKAAPQDVPQEVWDVMSPEERKLWE
jgi:hypothetical protein